LYKVVVNNNNARVKGRGIFVWLKDAGSSFDAGDSCFSQLLKEAESLEVRNRLAED
jgi:hypothetical protein